MSSTGGRYDRTNGFSISMGDANFAKRILRGKIVGGGLQEKIQIN